MKWGEGGGEGDVPLLKMIYCACAQIVVLIRKYNQILAFVQDLVD